MTLKEPKKPGNSPTHPFLLVEFNVAGSTDRKKITVPLTGNSGVSYMMNLGTLSPTAHLTGWTLAPNSTRNGNPVVRLIVDVEEPPAII